jgi:uncharacterized protein YndB with AHSA1/START domain
MGEAIMAVARASLVIGRAAEPLFDAWLDPTVATRFLSPLPLQPGDVTINPREGGGFSITMHADGEDLPHSGRYVVIDRPRRLVFTWVSHATEFRLSLVTVEFTPVDGGTRLDITHEGLSEAMQGPHTGGWTAILEKLATL